MKGEEKIHHYVWTKHGEQPVCKCGNFLTIVGMPAEWICIKCEPEKMRIKRKTYGESRMKKVE